MKNYFCEGWGGWFVVSSRNKRVARIEAVAEFGRGMVKDVREATESETRLFIIEKGAKALAG